MKIGIGICSYHRPLMAKKLADDIVKTIPGDHSYELVCSVDDNNTEGYESLLLDNNRFEVIYGENKGIACNKNRLLRFLRDNDVIFILEDDVQILDKGWVEKYLQAIQDTGWHHFSYLFKHYQEDITEVKDFGSTKIGFGKLRFNGVLLVMTKHCLDLVGGFDTNFGKYGFEHTNYHLRASKQNLCPPVSTHVMGMDQFITIPFPAESTISEEDKSDHIKKALPHFTWNVQPPYHIPIEADYWVVLDVQPQKKSPVRFIHATVPYREDSAGCRVIHYFAYLMRLAGFDSYITSDGNPEWGVPKFNGSIGPRDIVIYPEIYHNTNPLMAMNVARYILYFPSFRKMDRISKKEFCIPYHPFLFDECVQYYEGKIEEKNTLTLGCIDPTMFNNVDAVKNVESMYWIGKGEHNWPSAHLPANSIRINIPISRQDLAKTLRSTKVLYNFDDHSAVSAEAMLCGCEVYILEKDKPPRMHGMPDAFPMDEAKDKEAVIRLANNMIEFFKL